MGDASFMRSMKILTPRIGFSGPPPPPPPPPRVKSMSQETEILLLQSKSMSNTKANTLSNGKHGIQRLTHYPKTNTQSNQVTQPERSKGAKDEVKRPFLPILPILNCRGAKLAAAKPVAAKPAAAKPAASKVDYSRPRQTIADQGRL